MALPDDAEIFAAITDSADVVDWYANLTGKTLEPGEAAESYILSPSAEFVALGGEIMNGGDRTPALINSNTILKFWTQFAEGSQSDPAFDGSGVTLGLLLTVVTNNIPYRKKQRTLGIKVKQR